MKKFLFTLVISVVTCLFGTCMVSCDNIAKHLNHCESVDTAQVSKVVDKCLNPHFYDVMSFYNYTVEEVAYQEFVTTASMLSPTTINAIASKCISDYGFCDYHLFLDEFREHRSVYENVEKAAKNQEKTVELTSTTTVILDSVPPILNSK